MKSVDLRLGTTDDVLYDAAVKLILTERRASASLLEETLKIPFSRAWSLIEHMQHAGIVGPNRGLAPRPILLRLDEYERMRA